MAFCSGGLAAIRHIWNNIDPELEKVVEDVTEITGKIKALLATPTAQAIEAIIPEGMVITVAIGKALDLINGVAGEVDTVAKQISKWLDGKTELQANADLLKLASVTAKQLDPTPNEIKTESFYDSAVQLHIIVNKNK